MPGTVLSHRFQADVFGPLGLGTLTSRGESELFAELPAPVAGPQPPADQQDVLDTLHREFMRVVADPSQLYGRAAWPVDATWLQAQSAAARDLHGDREPHGSAPGFEELSRQASIYERVLDVVHPRESLDGFIARFVGGLEPAEPPTLLLDDRADEVLQLFASPEAVRRPAPLPLTTRRDHHDLSPDSAVHIGRFVLPSQEGPHEPDAAAT